MGCCYGQLYYNIIHNSDVVAYAAVGDIGLVNGPMSTLYKNRCCRHAVLYIRGDSLYFWERTLCWRPLSLRFPLELIDTTEALRNEAVNILEEEILLNPGLQITVRGDNGLFTTLSAVMPDANKFANELRKSVDKYKDIHK